MKLRANGQLQHCFWGDYHAKIILSFEDEQSATLARSALSCGMDWKQAGGAIGVFVDSEQLKVVTDLLVKHGAVREAIDSVAHSIDYGDPFDITVEVQDPKQVLMAI